MNIKKLITLFIVLVAVVGIIGVAEKFGNREPAQKSLYYFPGFTEESCSGFLIADKKDTVKIKRKQGIWVVSSGSMKSDISASMEKDTAESSGQTVFKEYRADSAALASAMDKLKNMKKDELISQNPEKQALFEVDTIKGIYVEIWDTQGASLGSFRIGKSGPDYSSNFVRMMGSDDVHTVRGSIRYAFFSDKKRWKDKTMLKLDPSDIVEYTIAQKDSAVISVEKSVDTSSQEIWTIVSPEKLPADGENVKKALNEICNLKTDDWEENTSLTNEEMGFGDPTFLFTLKLSNGEIHTLTLGSIKEDAKRYWAKVKELETVFLLSAHTLGKFNKTIPFLKAKEKENKEEK